MDCFIKTAFLSFEELRTEAHFDSIFFNQVPATVSVEMAIVNQYGGENNLPSTGAEDRCSLQPQNGYRI